MWCKRCCLRSIAFGIPTTHRGPSVPGSRPSCAAARSTCWAGRGRIEAAETWDPEAYETFAAAANTQDENRDAKTVLDRAVTGLPPGQRQALELVKLCELSLADASRLSGKSVGALKSNVHRALKALRVRLNGE
jgi:DNA-directed RNA polymerase specialized sigma24 family protein